MLTIDRVKEIRAAGVNSCSPADFRELCNSLLALLEKSVGQRERHVEMLGSLDDKVSDAMRSMPESFTAEPARVDEL